MENVDNLREKAIMASHADPFIAASKYLSPSRLIKPTLINAASAIKIAWERVYHVIDDEDHASVLQSGLTNWSINKTNVQTFIDNITLVVEGSIKAEHQFQHDCENWVSFDVPVTHDGDDDLTNKIQEAVNKIRKLHQHSNQRCAEDKIDEYDGIVAELMDLMPKFNREDDLKNHYAYVPPATLELLPALVQFNQNWKNIYNHVYDNLFEFFSKNVYAWLNTNTLKGQLAPPALELERNEMGEVYSVMASQIFRHKLGYPEKIYTDPLFDTSDCDTKIKTVDVIMHNHITTVDVSNSIVGQVWTATTPRRGIPIHGITEISVDGFKGYTASSYKCTDGFGRIKRDKAGHNQYNYLPKATQIQCIIEETDDNKTVYIGAVSSQLYDDDKTTIHTTITPIFTPSMRATLTLKYSDNTVAVFNGDWTIQRQDIVPKFAEYASTGRNWVIPVMNTLHITAKSFDEYRAFHAAVNASDAVVRADRYDLSDINGRQVLYRGPNSGKW